MTEEHVPVRLSHLLRDCSVGAIVRGPDSLMVVQDTRTWDRPGNDPMDREIRYVDRVGSALGIDQALCAPPRSEERNGAVIGWVPALRFPTWMHCLRCGLLHSAPWRRRRVAGASRHEGETGGGGSTAECSGSGCGGRLEQVPWVLVTTKAIWPTCPGTVSPTENPGTRSRLNAAPTGKSPVCG